jgi:hypothetical protein
MTVAGIIAAVITGILFPRCQINTFKIYICYTKIQMQTFL